MIDKEALRAYVEKELGGTDYFLVDIRVSDGNEIAVEIDSMENADIDFCIDLTRKIESEFDRDVEDYELEVGSAGLTSPFKVLRQYEKHLGDDVEILEKGGKKMFGVLKEVGPEKFTVEISEKVKPEGAKRPVIMNVDRSFGYDDVKYVKYNLKF